MKTASKNFQKAIKDHGQNVLVDVTMKLEYFEGNKLPYFSLTAHVYKANKKGERDKRYKDSIGGGACHDTILKAFPNFKDFADFHLRDSDGKPMHVVENGFYFVQNGKVDALANHLLVSTEQAQEIIDTCKTKEEFAELATTMYERWEKMANDLMDKYELCLPDNFINRKQ